MNKLSPITSIISSVVLVITIGSTFLPETDEGVDFKNESKLSNTNAVILKQKAHQECILKLLSLKDTLTFETISIKETGVGYAAEFIYPKFRETTPSFRQLNQIITSIVFDKMPNSKAYFSKKSTRTS
ncbi:MAG: hypothetical protein ACPG49_12955 [Chitinophagales bacterium]